MAYAATVSLALALRPRLITSPAAIRAAFSARRCWRADPSTAGLPLLIVPPAATRAACADKRAWRFDCGFAGRPRRAVFDVFDITLIFYFYYLN
jgi:hypothetical protein